MIIITYIVYVTDASCSFSQIKSWTPIEVRAPVKSSAAPSGSPADAPASNRADSNSELFIQLFWFISGIMSY